MGRPFTHIAITLITTWTILVFVGCSDSDQPDPTLSEPDAPTDVTDPNPDPEPAPTPLNMILLSDGVTYLGTAVVDITPEILETYTDLNNNSQFDGCIDDPSGERCDEPFDDVNGNGYFDAVYKRRLQPLHPLSQSKPHKHSSICHFS